MASRCAAGSSGSSAPAAPERADGRGGGARAAPPGRPDGPDGHDGGGRGPGRREGGGGSGSAGAPPSAVAGGARTGCGGRASSGRRLSTRTRSRVPNSSTQRPAPRATACSGSSAACTGTPSSWLSRSSSPRSSAPPPVRAMPRSTTSPASSGGQTSSTVRTSSTICTTGVSMARRTSADPIVTVLGSPVTRSRPRTRSVQLLAQREGRARADLEVLGAALAQQQRVLALDVGDERLVDLVAADAHRARADDAAEADDRDVGGAAADVDHHRRPGLLDRAGRRRSRRPSVSSMT